MSRVVVVSVLGVAFAVACQSTPEGGVQGDVFVTKPEGTSSSSGTTGEDEPEPSRHDMGALEDAVDAADPCKAVDLLFVVDNSGSMADEQVQLVAGFPGFIAGISSILGADTDYHVGVVTTDANQYNGVGCRKLGALVTRTGGEESSHGVCGPYADGFRFMTPADPLADAFGCAAQVGIEGDGDERPMAAVTELLGNDAGSLALCNDEFLRDGALLVLTIITDEEDDGQSPGDPASWYDAVVAAKGGDPSRVVVLSLVGHGKPNACIPEQWDGMQGAEIATRILEFTEMFEHGNFGDVCENDYGNFFTESIDGIADACSIVVGPD